MRPSPGQLINNKYRLLRLIGDGGMGSVYEAQHEVLGTSVALKFLHPELSRRSGLVQRFLQEARVSARIHSEHVVRVTDVDQTPNGLAFIVMEYLQGQSLQTMYEDLYQAGKRLGYEKAVEYALQMMEGLEAAHAEGIIHRDLKPDNVMIVKGRRGDEVLKLLDFGIAKLKVSGELEKGLTRPGVVMGTPEYMAPEQAFSADQVDARADIFSLGVMIFEMLAGRRPVGGDEPHQIASQYLTGNVAQLSELAPHVPGGLAEAIHKAMAASPNQRWATVAALREAVEPFGKGSTSQPPVSPATPSPPVAAISPVAVSAATPAAATPEQSSDTPASGSDRAVPKTLLPDQVSWQDVQAAQKAEAAAEAEASDGPPATDEALTDGGPYGSTAKGIGGPQPQPAAEPEGIRGDATVESPPPDMTGEPEPAKANQGTEILRKDDLPSDAHADRKDGVKKGKAGTEMIRQDGSVSPAAQSLPAVGLAAAGVGAVAAGAAGAVGGPLPATSEAAPLGADPEAGVGPVAAEAGAAAVPTTNVGPEGGAFGSTELAPADALPGQTQAGDSPYDSPHAGTAPMEPMPGGRTAPGGAMPGMDAGHGVTPMGMTPAAAYAPHKGSPRKKSGIGLGGILFLAAAAAAIVVGGVYAAEEYSADSASSADESSRSSKKKKSSDDDDSDKDKDRDNDKDRDDDDDDDDDVGIDPPDTDPTEDPVATTPPPPPPPPPPTSKPTNTAPPPTSTTPPPPPPTSTTDPPFILPSAPVIPGIEIPGMGRPTPPASPPPTSTPPPATTGTGRPQRPTIQLPPKTGSTTPARPTRTRPSRSSG